MNVLQVAGGNAKGDMNMRGRKGGMKGKHNAKNSITKFKIVILMKNSF